VFDERSRNLSAFYESALSIKARYDVTLDERIFGSTLCRRALERFNTRAMENIRATVVAIRVNMHGDIYPAGSPFARSARQGVAECRIYEITTFNSKNRRDREDRCDLCHLAAR